MWDAGSKSEKAGDSSGHHTQWSRDHPASETITSGLRHKIVHKSKSIVEEGGSQIRESIPALKSSINCCAKVIEFSGPTYLDLE
jgi:hypothetical protein